MLSTNIKLRTKKYFRSVRLTHQEWRVETRPTILGPRRFLLASRQF